MKLVQITHTPNPLNNDGRTVKQLAVTSSNLYELLKAHGYLNAPCTVKLNGIGLSNAALKIANVRSGDIVSVKGAAKDPVGALAFFFLDAGLFLGAELVVAGALVSIGTNLLVSLATNFLISSLSGGGGSGNATDRNNRKDAESYGVSGGGNATRRFQPLQLVMGKHRVYPDFASRWFTDYVKDTANPVNVLNNTPHAVATTIPPFSFSPTPAGKAWNSFTTAEKTPNAPWVLRAGQTFPSAAQQDVIYGDGAARSYATPNGAVNKPNTFLCKWTSPDIGQPWTASPLVYCTQEEFDNPSIATFVGGDEQYTYSVDWQPRPSSNQFNVVDYYGNITYENTQRLTAIFNYGFGDLLLTDHYIGTSPAVQDYRDLAIEPPLFQNASVKLNNWTPSDASAAIEHPSDCEMVEGGGLSKKTGQSGEWVERQSSRLQATHLEVDITGRLFYNGGSGPETSSVVIEIQYRTTTGGAWTPAPMSPVTISNGDTTPVRNTYRWPTPSNAHYAVRVRKNTDNATDSRLVQDINFESHRAYNYDTTGYPYQHRLGVQIRASKQLNGALDRWSSLASAKAWVYTGGAVWDGTSAGNGGNWAWQETSNPAWWFLYFLLGGHENYSVQNTHPLFGRGWHIGEHSANELRLFGCGRLHDEIDYTSIVRWAAFCATKNLEFGGVLDSARPADDVLQDIARIGRASRNQANGKMGVVYMQASDPTVQMFGMGNIVAGSFAISYISEQSVDEVVLTYADRSADYGSKQVRAVVPNTPQPIKESSINLWGCTSTAQAQRECNLVAAEQRFLRRRVSFETDIEGLQCQRWDVITLGHDLTNWAQTGRVVDFVITGSVISAIVLDRDLDPMPAGSGWVQWRTPVGGFAAMSITAPTAVIPAGTPIAATSVVNASFAAGELSSGSNLASNYPNSYPEDFVYHASPAQSVGKRLRVISVQPQANERVQIVCTDESPEWYAYEYTPWPAYLAPVPQERLIARAFNVGVIRENDGALRVVWELDNALGADVSIAAQGATGLLTVPGVELVLQNYPAGTVLNISVSPQPMVSAVGIEPASFSFTI